MQARSFIRFENATFSSGGTISGSFDFDADAGTACSTDSSPCGLYSNVNVTTTTDGTLSGSTYSFVCGQDVVSCTGVVPDSTEVQFLTSNAANQMGLPALAVFFLAPGPLPPSGLSDAGGTFDISNTIAGVAVEAACADGACSTPASTQRDSNAGVVTSAVPEPATWAFLLTGVGAMTMLRRRRTAKNR